MLRKKWGVVSLGGLLAVLLVTSSKAAEGAINSWTSTNGPEGGPIRALAIDPQTPATVPREQTALRYLSSMAAVRYRPGHNQNRPRRGSSRLPVMERFDENPK
jgi:hypothetical protein